MAPNSELTPAVFLDRDGVLNEDAGYTYRVEDLVLVPGVAGALTALRAAGFKLVVVSNQSGVARGYFGVADVERFHGALRAEIVTQGGPQLDDVLFCPHGVDDGCACRKPKPGMVLEAAAKHGIDLSKSWLVGDKESDVACAVAAGVRGVQVVGAGGSAVHPQAVAVVRDLVEAARMILLHR